MEEPWPRFVRVMMPQDKDTDKRRIKHPALVLDAEPTDNERPQSRRKGLFFPRQAWPMFGLLVDDLKNY